MSGRVVRLLAICALGVVFGTTRSHAGGFVTTIASELNAKYVVVEMYTPASGQEYKLLDALVKSGPFDKGPESGFVNERILQVLPRGEGGSAFLVLGRYYDPSVAKELTQARNTAVKPFLIVDPARLELKSVEHVLGDWGWERGTPQKVEAVQHRSVATLRHRDLSMSFLKIGYVGQVATLRFFPVGTSLREVLAQMGAQPNLSGCSIFQVEDNGPYVAYAEFFKSPGTKMAQLTSAGKGLSEFHAGVVVENYSSR